MVLVATTLRIYAGTEKRPLATGQAPQADRAGAELVGTGGGRSLRGERIPRSLQPPARIAALCWRCQEAAGHLGNGERDN